MTYKCYEPYLVYNELCCGEDPLEDGETKECLDLLDHFQTGISEIGDFEGTLLKLNYYESLIWHAW